MSATKRRDLTHYHRFRAELGISTAELQECFAQEVMGLTTEELLILKASDFTKPASWTTEQERVYLKMLARAAVKAKQGRTRS